MQVEKIILRVDTISKGVVRKICLSLLSNLDTSEVKESIICSSYMKEDDYYYCLLIIS